MLCPSERMTPSSSYECYEILVAHKTSGTQVGLHFSVDHHCFLLCSCGELPSLSPPLLSLLIHGLSAVLNTNRGGQGDGSHFHFFFLILAYNSLVFVLALK